MDGQGDNLLGEAHPGINSQSESEDAREALNGLKRIRKSKCSFLEGILIVMGAFVFVIVVVFVVVFFAVPQVPSLYSTDDIRRPLLDNRKYEIIELLNGMKVMLVSDAGTSQSSLGLSINRGSHHDNEYHVYGIGNLVMTMMLSCQARIDLDDLTYKNYGGLLARTQSLHDSVFSYDISNDGFLTSVELFAQMLKFDYKDEAELKQLIELAINSAEASFQKNKRTQKDPPILNLLYKGLDYNHLYLPSGKRSLLTNATFTYENLKEVVLRYHKNVYTGSNMRLVLLSKRSLKEMKGLVIKSFADIPGKPQVKREAALVNLPSSKLNLGTVLFAKLGETYSPFKMQFFFENIPLDSTHYFYQYVFYLFNDKLEGSLNYHLQKRGFLTVMLVHFEFIKDDTMMLDLSLQLTQKGYDNVDEVIFRAFNYINTVREHKNAEERYSDLKTVFNTKFKFKESTVSNRQNALETARNMLVFSDNITELLMGDNYTPPFDPKYIEALLKLLVPTNSIVLFNSQGRTEASLRKIKALLTSEEIVYTREGLYDIEYFKGSFSQESLKQMKEERRYDKYFSIRKKNNFLTTLTEIVNPETEEERNKIAPRLVINENHFKVWHKLDRTSHIPLIHCDFLLNSPFHPSNSSYSYMLYLLHYHYVSTAINLQLSDAREAGSDIQINLNEERIIISINAYSDVFERILNAISQYYFLPEASLISEDVVVKLAEAYLKQLKSNPVYHITTFFKGLLKNYLWMQHDPVFKDDITDIYAKIREKANHTYVRMIFYGNIPSQSAIEIARKSIEPHLDKQSHFFSTTFEFFNEDEVVPYLNNIKYVMNVVVFRAEPISPSEESLVGNYYYLGSLNNERDAVFIHLFRLTILKYYQDELAKSSLANTISFLLFQSSNGYFAISCIDKEDPRSLNYKLDSLLKKVERKLALLDEEKEMYKLKESILVQLNKKDVTLNERTIKVRNEISANRFAFDEGKRYTIEELNAQFTKRDLQNYFIDVFKRKVSKLSIQRNSTEDISLDDDGYLLNSTIPTVVTKNKYYFHK